MSPFSGTGRAVADFNLISSRAHDEVEWMPGETYYGLDEADFFVQSASTFKMILKYLPNVTSLKRNFKRDADGSWEQIKTLYFVVEKHGFKVANGYAEIFSIAV
jgi:hypothetical protein